ncbi:MAG TPA: YncE family protein [Puia sp.]|jgi:DNA-binding beta-propeller fold protein YncE
MNEGTNMKYCIILIPVLLCNCFWSCKGQSNFGTNLLQKEKEIPLEKVNGRIDHMDVDIKGRKLFVAALGNNSLEVIDLRSGKTLHSITGLDEPQGIGYIPEHNEIFVANGGNGNCYFYNAQTFEQTGSINLGSDADDVRYDSVERKIYVGYGNGGIAVINADTHTKTVEISLPGHPESFQLDKIANQMYVNVPDAKIIAVIDLKQLKVITKWKTNAGANFPMAVDEVQGRVFIGYRHPPELSVLERKTGREIYKIPMSGDSDDVYYDAQTKKIYESGGQGYINIFQEQNSNAFIQVANIQTRSGARTSLLVSSLNLYIVAARAEGNQPASLFIYRTTQ